MSIPESSPFQAGTFDQWYQQVSKELKGSAPEQRIYWTPESGISLPPFATPDSASKFSFPRKANLNGNLWGKGYALPAGISPRQANKLALQMLQSGADTLLWPNRDGAASVGADMEVLFTDIKMPFIQNHFRYLGISDATMYALMSVCDKNGFDAKEIQGSFLCDGLFSALSCGNWIKSAQVDLQEYAEFAGRMHMSFPGLRVAFDGTLFHESGADRIHELAWIIASVHEQWLCLSDSVQASKGITLYVSVDHEILPQIAKFRALRLLWKMLFKPYGQVPELEIIAIPSNRSMTVFDCNNNILRRTAAMYAAITGGADTVMASAFQPGSESDHRVMMNLHHLLSEEAHLHYVNDPSAGAYSIDELALQQAEHAWELFKKIEFDGGITTWILNGTLQKMAEEQASALKHAYLNRKLILIGSNMYAQSGETAPEVPLMPFDAIPGDIEKLQTIRIAEELELFRKDTITHCSGFVFTLLKFGPGAMSTARANFISDFLSCGGFNWVEEEWDGTSLYTTKSQFLILCSSDEQYAPALKNINIQSETKVFIAGNPENIEELKTWGASGFIHTKSPLFETLKTLKKMIL